MRNTSQDPEYEGLPYHEKKFHKTHFSAIGKKLKSDKNSKNEWVRIGLGKYMLLPKKRDNAADEAEVNNAIPSN